MLGALSAAADGWRYGAQMIAFEFNGKILKPSSTEELGCLLDRLDECPMFELWAKSASGAALCMLRNGDAAWLMYLQREGDGGFSSRSTNERSGSASFLLSNGQRDEFPLSWCIDVEQCYKAMAYFFENDGARPEWITWHEDELRPMRVAP